MWGLELGTGALVGGTLSGGLALICSLFWAALRRQRRRMQRALDGERELLRLSQERLEGLEVRVTELTAEHAEYRRSLEEARRASVASELRRVTSGLKVAPEGGARLDKKHQVVSLAQMGYDSRDISRKLRLPRGETELLLGLCGCAAVGAGDGRHPVQ